MDRLSAPFSTGNVFLLLLRMSYALLHEDSPGRTSEHLGIATSVLSLTTIGMGS